MSNKSKYFKSKKDYITFNIMNEDMLKRLQNDGEVVLPKRKVQVPKDRQWNTKQIHSKLIQGMERGDSVYKIARNMRDVMDNNSKSAIRAARTMVTSAENHGRLDSYKTLTDDGVVMKKYWMATPDDRTRPSHVDIDGEEQDVDKEFSNGCMYPGDGHGPAEEVWCCRCSMGSHVIGFKKDNGKVAKVEYNEDRTMHDTQMANERRRRTRIRNAALKNVAVTTSKVKKYVDVEERDPKKKKRRKKNAADKNKNR